MKLINHFHYFKVKFQLNQLEIDQLTHFLGRSFSFTYGRIPINSQVSNYFHVFLNRTKILKDKFTFIADLVQIIFICLSMTIFRE